MEVHLETVEGFCVAGSEFRGVNLCDTTVEFAVYGIRYKTVETPYSPEPYLVPIQSVSTATVSHMWLDLNHPGWAKRYALASELGYDTSDIVKAMFSSRLVEPTKELPDDLIVT